MKRATREQWYALLEALKAENSWTTDQWSEILEVEPAQVRKFFRKDVVRISTLQEYFARVAVHLGHAPDVLERRARLLNQYGLESAHQCLEIGETLTLFTMASGNGRRAILIDDVNVEVDDDHTLALPLPVEEAYAKVRAEHAKGLHTYRDNPLLTLRSAEWFPPRGADERPFIDLKVCTTPYSLLYTMRKTDAGRKLFTKLIDNWKLEQGEISPVLGQGLGVNAAVISSDNHFFVGRRKDVGVRASQIDVGAVEGLNLDDGQTTGTNTKPFDVDAIMRRAVDEEYGLTDDTIESCTILGLGFDLGWSQWNVIGFIRTNCPAEQVYSRWKSHAIHKPEYSEIEAIAADPESVLSFMQKERAGVWSCGLATAYYTLVNQHGIAAVERAAKGKRFQVAHNLL